MIKIKIFPIAFLLFLAGLLASCGINQESKQLIIEQTGFNSSDPTGIVKATAIFTWENGKIISVHHIDEYESTEKTAEMFLKLQAEFDGNLDWHLNSNGNLIMYDEISFQLWSGKSYSEVYNAYDNDPFWNIVR